MDNSQIVDKITDNFFTGKAGNCYDICEYENKRAILCC